MVVRTERLDEETLLLKVQGEVDVYTAPELATRITEQAGAYKFIIVDLGGTEYIDSSGIGVLSGCQGQVQELGGSLRIVTTNDRVLRAFRIAGIPDMRLVFPTVEAAMESARGRQEVAEGRRQPIRGELQMTLLRRPEYVATVRLVVGSIGARLDLSYQEVEDIKLAVGEAWANALRHGAPVEGPDRIHLDLNFDEDTLVIQVRDPSTHVDWDDILARAESGQRVGAGGLGLMLMKHLMDEVEFGSCPEEGNCVRLVKRLRREI